MPPATDTFAHPQARLGDASRQALCSWTRIAGAEPRIRSGKDKREEKISQVEKPGSTTSAARLWGRSPDKTRVTSETVGFEVIAYSFLHR